MAASYVIDFTVGWSFGEPQGPSSGSNFPQPRFLILLIAKRLFAIEIMPSPKVIPSETHAQPLSVPAPGC
jgi:hypothetical protein